MTLYIAVGSLLVASTASAASKNGECHGTLHWEKGDFLFGGGAGEGEGICVVARSEHKKIMQQCSPGTFCRVRGTKKPCQDSGECVEIRHVDKVQKN
jgi:hypothetical protein